MKRFTLFFLFLLTVPIFGASLSSPKDCYLDSGVKVECFSYFLEPDGELKVVRLKKTSSEKKQYPPLVLIAGGPGQGAVKTFTHFLHGFKKSQRRRDILLVDQLGTGDSSPLLCDSLSKITAIDQMIDQSGTLELFKTCAKQIKSLDNAPEAFGTDAYVTHLDKIREELGYEKISIYGVSYGSRVGVRYGMLFEDHLESMVLEGVAGNELVLFENAKLGNPIALKSIEERQKDAGVSDNMLLGKRMEKLFETLPKMIEFQNPASGKPVSLMMDQFLAEQAIRLFYYDPTLASTLPYAISEAISGNFQSLVTPMLANDFGLNQLHLFTVSCNEDFHGKDLIGKMPAKQYAQVKDLCEVWPRFSLAKDFRSIPKFKAPTLLLNGSADPATPVAFAERLDQNLPQSRLVVFKHFGHNVFGLPCAQNLVADFFADPKGLENLSTDCVATVKVPEFFSNGLGPK